MNNKKTILYISGSKEININGFDGKARNIKETIFGLKKVGFKVIFVTGFVDKKIKGKDIIQIKVNKLCPNHLYNRIMYKKILNELEKRNVKPDLIYERYSYNGDFANLLAKKFNIKHIMEVNHSFVYGVEKKKYTLLKKNTKINEQRILKKADNIVTVSSVMKEYLCKIGIPSKKIQIIPFCVNIKKFNLIKKSSKLKRLLGLDKKYVIGFVGSFQDYHGLDLILKCVKYLKELDDVLFKKIKFLLIGEGKNFAKFKKAMKKNKLNDSILLMGKVKPEKINEFIYLFDIAILSSFRLKRDRYIKEYHGFPAKLVEYLTIGKATVIPNIRVFREKGLKDKINCIFYNEEDFRDFSKKIIFLINNKDLKKNIGINAKKLAKSQFNINKKIEIIKNFL